MKKSKKDSNPLWLKLDTDYSLLLRAYEKCYNALMALWDLSEEKLKLIQIYPPKIYSEDNFYYKDELEKAHQDLHN